MSVELHNLIQVIPDLLLILWFFRTVESVRRPKAIQTAGSIAALAATIFLYFIHGLNGYTLRFLYRFVCYTLFLRLYHGVCWRRCVFCSLFASTCWISCQNILFTPLLFPIVQNTLVLAVHPLLKECFVTLLRVLIMALPLALVSYLAPFRNISGSDFTEWGVLIIGILCSIYVKQTLNVTTRVSAAHPLEESLFPIFLQLFLLAFLAFFERNLHAVRQRQEIYAQETVNHYRLQSLESKQIADADLRQTYHDMKNHLMAIRTLSEGESSQAARYYIDSLVQSMQTYENQVEVGNLMLNGLLTQKVMEANRNEIVMNLIVDFRKIDFIEDMDLCTIFGNTIDNALEACSAIPGGCEKQILLRTQESAGQLLINISNTYQGEIHFADGLPRTSKVDPETHGIGLRNIHRVLKKYNGVMDINLKQPGWFSLTMLIPFPGN